MHAHAGLTPSTCSHTSVSQKLTRSCLFQGTTRCGSLQIALRLFVKRYCLSECACKCGLQDGKSRADAKAQRKADREAAQVPAAEPQDRAALAGTVFVRGLPADTSQFQLQASLATYGAITSCRPVAPHPPSPPSMAA